jgi:hypothetical protein
VHNWIEQRLLFGREYYSLGASLNFFCGRGCGFLLAVAVDTGLNGVKRNGLPSIPAARLAGNRTKISCFQQRLISKEKRLSLAGPFSGPPSILWYPLYERLIGVKGNLGTREKGKSGRRKKGVGILYSSASTSHRPFLSICSWSCKAHRSHIPRHPLPLPPPLKNIDSTCLTIRIDFRLSVLANPLPPFPALSAPVHSRSERNVDTVSHLPWSPSHILSRSALSPHFLP